MSVEAFNVNEEVGVREESCLDSRVSVFFLIFPLFPYFITYCFFACLKRAHRSLPYTIFTIKPNEIYYVSHVHTHKHTRLVYLNGISREMVTKA